MYGLTDKPSTCTALPCTAQTSRGSGGGCQVGAGGKAITLYISSVIPYIKVSIQGGAIKTFNVSAYVPGLPVLLSAANTLKEMGIKAIRQGGSDN